MYKNLLAEMVRYGYDKKFLAQSLKLSDKSISNKLNGTTSFTVPEAKKIMEIIPGSHTFDYLFAVDGESKAS